RVLHSLEQALAKDRAKTNVNGFSQLGLVLSLIHILRCRRPPGSVDLGGRRVLHSLEQALAYDRAKTNVNFFSQLGLL
ncbi:hypothetical protein ACQ4LF_23615, partial [Aeromonas salmonicida]